MIFAWNGSVGAKLPENISLLPLGNNSLGLRVNHQNLMLHTIGDQHYRFSDSFHVSNLKSEQNIWVYSIQFSDEILQSIFSPIN